MLSYRHSYHAGNFADVLKHIVLIELLSYITQKNKPFDYIDTHAGAGLYQLYGEDAEKTGEWRKGVSLLLNAEADKKIEGDIFFAAYLSLLRAFNASGELRVYPGSPLIADKFLRGGDKAWLHELHPQDFGLLQHFFQRNRRV